MNTIAITAMREGTGKTALTIALGKIAQERGARVGYMKPKGTRLESAAGKVIDSDPLLAAELLGLDAELRDMEPIIYSPTFVENAVSGQIDREELIGELRESFTSLASECDIMLIEGAGKFDVGRIIDLADPVVADLLEAQVVLVAEFDEYRDLDAILGATSAFESRLTGVLFNRITEQGTDRLEQHGIPFLRGQGHDVLGVIPHDRTIAGLSVTEFGEELGGRWLTSTLPDAYIDRFLVGAMGAEEALRQFRRSKNTAVVTGGDRTEIHAAAIEASGVPCLIVTGGIRPPDSLLSRAERAGVAVLAVDGETMITVERAEQILRSGRSRDPAMIEQMKHYLEEHVAIDQLLHR